MVAESHLSYLSTQTQSSVIINTKKAKGATYIPVVKANGDVLCSFYVFKAKSDPEEQRPVSKFVLPPAKRALRGTWPRFYLFTKSSYVDKRAWKVIMETIVQRWTIENPGLWGRLFMDNFDAHRDLEAVLDA